MYICVYTVSLAPNLEVSRQMYIYTKTSIHACSSMQSPIFFSEVVVFALSRIYQYLMAYCKQWSAYLFQLSGSTYSKYFAKYVARVFVYRNPKTMSDAHGGFEIFVYFTSGDCLSVLADERTIVRDLLELCRDYVGLPRDTWLGRMKIFHHCRPLDYCCNLSRLGVRAGDCLHVLVVS